MVDELRRQDWVPRRVRRDERELAEVHQRVQSRLGRAPRDEELAGELGVEPERLERLRTDLSRADISSLDTPIDGIDDDVSDRLSTIASPTDDPLASVLRSEDRAAVRRGLSALTPREREVAALIYISGLSQREAGKHLGITESRVSQLHTSLRRTLRSQIGEASEATAAHL